MRGLRKSCAPISGFVRPSRGEPGDLLLLRRELVARLGAALAHLLARRQQLAAGALGERLHADRRRTSRGRCAAARARRRAGSRGAATRRRAGARGRAPAGAACGRAGRSPRGRAPPPPRPRSAAPARAPRSRAPSRCRSRLVASARRSSGLGARVGVRRSGRAASTSSGSAQSETKSSGVSSLACSRCRQRLLVAAEAVVEHGGRPARVLDAQALAAGRGARRPSPRAARRPRPRAPAARRAACRRTARSRMPVAPLTASASAIERGRLAKSPLQRDDDARALQRRRSSGERAGVTGELHLPGDDRVRKPSMSQSARGGGRGHRSPPEHLRVVVGERAHRLAQRRRRRCAVRRVTAARGRRAGGPTARGSCGGGGAARAAARDVAQRAGARQLARGQRGAPRVEVRLARELDVERLELASPPSAAAAAALPKLEAERDLRRAGGRRGRA